MHSYSERERGWERGREGERERERERRLENKHLFIKLARLSEGLGGVVGLAQVESVVGAQQGLCVMCYVCP